MGIVDRASKALKDRGWSTGDGAVWSNGTLLWMVYAHRGEHRVVARHVSLTDSWREALRLAIELRREQFERRWQEIEAEVATLDPASADRGRQLEEQDRLEYELGWDQAELASLLQM